MQTRKPQDLSYIQRQQCDRTSIRYLKDVRPALGGQKGNTDLDTQVGKKPDKRHCQTPISSKVNEPEPGRVRRTSHTHDI